MLVDINLLPQKERERPVVLVAVLGVLGVAVLLWAIFFFMAQSQNNQQAATDAEYAQVAIQSEAVRAQLEASIGLNDEQQLQATVVWAEAYQFDTVPLLGDLVSRLPKRGFFDSFSFVKPNLGTLTIQFDTSREAAYYLAQLKASEMLASASLDSVTNEELDLIEEEDPNKVETNELIKNPRYLATYSLVYVDERLPAEEGTVNADGTVTEAPVTEETQAPATETPAEETVPAESEVDVQ
ncbi:fimbrial assembly protein [Planococcus versutus]|uniref:Fimbrial assembly protein n=1 Tax=Planococcus versutus TaxID=1302659 RepID=A0A1B1RXI4_9BACL|nr:fimbrial assembly protein [Planococcus versutus]ANU25643.1 fimbrial assembly protein [Planococcus versutus]